MIKKFEIGKCECRCQGNWLLSNRYFMVSVVDATHQTMIFGEQNNLNLVNVDGRKY